MRGVKLRAKGLYRGIPADVTWEDGKIVSATPSTLRDDLEGEAHARRPPGVETPVLDPDRPTEVLATIICALRKVEIVEMIGFPTGSSS